MAEYTAGSASVPITPDFSTFHERIGAELDEAEPQFAAAGDKAGVAYASAFQDQLKASFADLPDAVIKADADDTAAKAELDEAAKTRTATVKVNVDKSSLAQAKTALSDIGENAGKLAGNVGTVALAGSAVALAPQALGAGIGAAGIGVALGAAAADAGAFGAIAIPMFTAVTAAQGKLTTAQAAYNKATTDAGRASALKAEQQALAGLTPAEKQLATELTGLTGAWKQLQTAEQPVVGQAIAPWLKTAVDGMGLLKPLIEDGANAVGMLGREADTAVKSPFWQLFSSTLGTTGDLALQDFGKAAGSLADGLAHLFVTFAPDIDNLITKVPQLAGDFDKWAQNVKAGGLEDFFSKTFSHANLSTLKGDLDSVGKFFTTVSSATQSMSPLAFSGLSVLLEAIGELPPDAVIALTGLFLATKTIGAIGNIAGLAGNIISLGKTAAGAIGGLFGGAATTAESTAEGTAAGTAAGTSAATAFTSTFAAEVTAALPAAFTEVGASGSAESATAGTAMGIAAATAFGVAFAAEDALGVTAAMTAIGTEAAVEAGVAGAAVGTAFAGGFAAALGGEAAGVLGELGIAAGGLALLGAALAGGALGLAVGTGFTGGFALSGAKNAASGLEGDVKAATASAGTWLQPAGQQAATGFASGFKSEEAAIQAAAAQAKAWTQAGASGSNTWIQPHGQQAGQGFASGFTSAHNLVNSAASQLKSWVTSALPSPISWLASIGISVTQGLANGMISSGSLIVSAASYLASLVPSTISSLLGINSPAKAIIPLGSSVPEGFAVGVDSGTGFVTDSLGRLTDTTVSSLSALAQSQSLAALGVPSLGAGTRLPGLLSPLSTGQLQLVVTPGVSDGPVMTAIVNGLQFHIQGVNGGDVQGALGLGPVR